MKLGHNSVVGARLTSYVSRIERLAEERTGLALDIRGIIDEAKRDGYDAKALRALIRERAQDEQARIEHEALVEVYRTAIRGLADTPLGKAMEPGA